MRSLDKNDEMQGARKANEQTYSIYVAELALKRNDAVHVFRQAVHWDFFWAVAMSIFFASSLKCAAISPAFW